MEAEFARIFGKSNDYKLCKQCGAINWYENEICWDCHYEAGEDTFTETWWKEVLDWIRTENEWIEWEENQNSEIKYDDETLYNV